MVLTSYEYNISAFLGDVNPDDFKEEVLNSNIQSTYNHITVSGDVYYIIFDTELTDPDKETLTTLVGLHTTSNNIVYSYITKSTPIHNYINTEIYTKIDNFIYPGKNHSKEIGKIAVIAYMNPGITSFSVIIEDITNYNILCEKTFTNTEVISVLDLGVISNIPNDESIIEISLKKTGGLSTDRVYIDGTTIYYI